MGSRLSMASRADITRRYALAYAQASKKDKSTLLDEVCAVTGWSRDNARRRLAQARKPRSVGTSKRKPRSRKYPYGAVKVLQQVWATTGGQCGKYLAASIRIQLDLMCLYLVARSLDPTGRGQTRWTVRWKPALNAFAITFAGRWPAAET